MKPIDYTSLHSPVTKQDGDQFLASTPNATIARGASATFAAIAVIVCGLCSLGIIPFVFFMALFISPSIVSIIIGLFLSLMLLMSIVAGTILLVRYVIKQSRRDLVNAVRLQRFAQVNGFSYDAAMSAPNYNGIIFRDHDDDPGNSSNVLRSPDGRLEIANYMWTDRGGEHSTTNWRGYIRIKLERHVPEMLLLAKHQVIGRLTIADMPTDLAADQTVVLEGDFNDYFTLYAPSEYGADVRYIFAPDLMALLIDKTAAFDVQIIDDCLYVYSWQPFILGDEAVMQRLMGIVETVGKKMVDATDQYQDDHQVTLAQDAVAPQGLRLKKSKHVVRTVLVTLYVLVFVAIFGYGLISILG